MAQSFDLWGRFSRYNISRTGEEADIFALVSDWAVTEEDLRKGLTLVLQENPRLAEELGQLLASTPAPATTP